MPNNKQAAKRLRQSEERRKANKTDRSAMRTAVRQVLEADTSEAAQAALQIANKRIDKASKRNILHDNAASRLKSRVARAANSK
ncbi:MAG: 30S ribosomal protein S20 [bacterium]|jgi:small subunit ribosomal protein S20|nr:30S ribosomal protein S20 [Planctomycetota bacterium]HIL51464.1 30S ribosomal protein S20 [Planctomycetota bacterium]